MLRRKLFLVTAALFAATLWGCGSEQGSGGGIPVPAEIGDAALVGSSSCKVCHSLAHYSDNALVGSVPNALGIVHECEYCHGGGQYHRGLGPIPNAHPDITTCASCHTAPVEGVIASGKHMKNGLLSCTACHEPLKADKRMVGGKISCSQCHNDTLTASTSPKLAQKPFASEIYNRFSDGRHTGNHRANACAACHSHQGAVLMLSQPEKISTKAQIAALTPELTALGVPNVPSGGTANPAYLKQCATCHDPHTATLRGVGEIKETFQLASGLNWERTVYSAEFNLCTSCHQVNLKTEWNPTGGYSDAGVIEYQLADVYAKSESNPDPYTNTGIGYHTDSYQGRSFVDTHFKGLLYNKLYYYDVKDGVPASAEAPARALLQAMYDAYSDPNGPVNIEINGYNVNPGSPNACSACHDVHAANKIIAAGERVAGYSRDLNDDPRIKKAIAYGQGIGATHGNYMANPFARNVNNASNGNNYASDSCVPCHNGRDYVKMTVGASKTDVGVAVWNTVSCVSCHEMAKSGTTPAAPRTMPADYKFQFNSSTTEKPVVLTAGQLGNDQVCFECHKGRNQVGFGPTLPTPGPSASDTTQVYYINYLHYSPVFSTRYGAEGMIPTYESKDYTRTWAEAGHYHYNNNYPSTCVGCHKFHEEYKPSATTGRAQFDTVLTSNLCSSCHYVIDPAVNNVARSFNVLKARTKVFGDLLFDTILSELAKVVATNNDAAIIIQGVDGADVTLTAAQKTAFTTLFGANYAVGSEVAKQNKRLKTYITGSTRDATGSRLVTNKLAKAGAIWKNFNYDDKGGWAHNSPFSRQLMYDAIAELDPAMLTQLETRARTAFGALGLSDARIDALGLLGSTANGSLMRYLSVTDGTQRTLPVPEI
jgi:hypothetical protein